VIPGDERGHPPFHRSFLFAVQGFRAAFAAERNLKFMVGGMFFAIFCGIVLEIDALSWAIVLLCCGCVIGAELLNTAIENVVDLVSPEYHPLAGRAKDIAAGAVWWTCIFVAIVGIIVFGHALLT